MVPKMGWLLRMNSREMIGEFGSLGNHLAAGWIQLALSFTAGISAQDHALRRSQKLCHNCDTKPVFAAQIDFFDGSRLLILRNLLKIKMAPKIPAYRLIRQLFSVLSPAFSSRYFQMEIF